MRFMLEFVAIPDDPLTARFNKLQQARQAFLQSVGRVKETTKKLEEARSDLHRPLCSRAVGPSFSEQEERTASYIVGRNAYQKLLQQQVAECEHFLHTLDLNEENCNPRSNDGLLLMNNVACFLNELGEARTLLKIYGKPVELNCFMQMAIQQQLVESWRQHCPSPATE